MSETSEKPMIFDALHQLQAALSKVGAPKHGRNREQGYAYRAWDDVQQALSPALAASGIVILPDIEERQETTATTSRGTTVYRVLLRGRIRFVARDGSETSFQAFGEAADTGDKATSKAMTMLVKYALLHALQIPLEGVDDADATTPEESVSVDAEQAHRAVLERMSGCIGLDQLRERYRGLSREERSLITAEDLARLKAQAQEAQAQADADATRAAHSHDDDVQA